MVNTYKKISLLGALFLVSLTSVGEGTDTLALIKKEFMRQTLHNSFAARVYSNPSQIYYSQIYPYSKIAFGFEGREEQLALKEQLGKGYNRASVQLSSFVDLRENAKVWGKAYYKNAVSRAVVWNQTSDYELLYPYVMGDSIAGNLNSEEYFFKGAYTKKTGNFSIAAMFCYRGLLEYRAVDPRPKNKVADLKGTIGGAILINDKMNLGLDIVYGKYRQRNDVKFFSELGSSPEYHFVGLGRDYTRFFGDKLQTYYDGNLFNFCFSVQPKDLTGFSAAFGYQYFYFNKIIAELNNLPLSNLLSQHFSTDLIYKQKKRRNAFGGLLSFHQKRKLGTENIFGDATNKEYPKITEVKQFYFRENSISSSLFFEQQLTKKTAYSLAPQISLSSEEERYVYPRRRMSRTCFQSAIDASLSVLSELNSWRIKARFIRDKRLKPYISLEDMEDDKRFLPFLEHNFNAYSSSSLSLQTVLAWTRQINNQVLVQVEGLVTYHNYRQFNNSATNYQINLNLIF